MIYSVCFQCYGQENTATEQPFEKRKVRLKSTKGNRTFDT